MATDAICARCGAEKELPLARCACGHVPLGEERVLAIVCSNRILDAAGMREATARIRSGEIVNPSPAMLDRARAILAGRVEAPVALSPARQLGLVVLNLLLSPAIGWAIWFRWRARPGPGGRQALAATLPLSIAFGVAWLFGVFTPRG